MNAYEESAYYFCYEDCKLCDGYGWMDNPPNGCIVTKKAVSPGNYCCYDADGQIVAYIYGDNPDNALIKAKQWARDNSNVYSDNDMDNFHVVKIA